MTLSVQERERVRDTGLLVHRTTRPSPLIRLSIIVFMHCLMIPFSNTSLSLSLCQNGDSGLSRSVANRGCAFHALFGTASVTADCQMDEMILIFPKNGTACPWSK